MQFHFGNHVLDVDRRELRRGSDPVAVEPQVFDLLIYLVQNRDRVVSKDDLIASVWGGRIVSDSTDQPHQRRAKGGRRQAHDFQSEIAWPGPEKPTGLTR